MSIALTTGLAIGGIAAGVGGAAASAIGASKQASAANNATITEAQEAQNALEEQTREFNVNQTNEAPFLATGTQAVNELGALTSTPGQGLLTPWTGSFTAPTADQAAQTPGYQFELTQGEQQLQNSAAANGSLLTGGTAKAINDYAQGTASSNYQQTFTNALTQYQTAYNTFQNNQANTFNRLSTESGGGQTVAAELGQAGQAAASDVGNIDVNLGSQIGQNLQNSAAATASGYVGGANALTGGLNSAIGSLTLQQLLAQNNSAGSGPTDPLFPTLP